MALTHRDPGRLPDSPSGMPKGASDHRPTRAIASSCIGDVVTPLGERSDGEVSDRGRGGWVTHGGCVRQRDLRAIEVSVGKPSLA